MTPEEKELLLRTLKLSEDNNRILHSLQRTVRWQTAWSFIKVLIIVLPLVAGYIYLQPHFGAILKELKVVPESLKSMQELLNSANKF